MAPVHELHAQRVNGDLQLTFMAFYNFRFVAWLGCEILPLSNLHNHWPMFDTLNSYLIFLYLWLIIDCWLDGPTTVDKIHSYKVARLMLMFWVWTKFRTMFWLCYGADRLMLWNVSHIWRINLYSFFFFLVLACYSSHIFYSYFYCSSYGKNEVTFFAIQIDEFVEQIRELL